MINFLSQKDKKSYSVVESIGRLHYEKNDVLRTDFERDRGRIIHSTAFRRLMYKTQVFISPTNDHVRTRLSHCLEVAQIASCLARSLGLNEVLAETISLAHDLGHPPFGHIGEDALRDISNGQFDHNEHTLKIVTTEKAYVLFDGLNLTWETLEGIVKHNGPIFYPKKFIALFNEQFDLMLHMYPSLEAQVAGLSDDIAYHHHDLDDGIRAGLFTLEDVCDHVAFVKQVYTSVIREMPAITMKESVKEVIRRLINLAVYDVWVTTSKNTENIYSLDDVRSAGRALVTFSDEMSRHQICLKEFLYDFMYRSSFIQKETKKAFQLIKALVPFYEKNPERIPDGMNAIDFVACMTDRFAIQEAQKENIFYE